MTEYCTSAAAATDAATNTTEGYITNNEEAISSNEDDLEEDSTDEASDDKKWDGGCTLPLGKGHPEQGLVAEWLSDALSSRRPGFKTSAWQT
jgi:hypothetical protein